MQKSSYNNIINMIIIFYFPSSIKENNNIILFLKQKQKKPFVFFRTMKPAKQSLWTFVATQFFVLSLHKVFVCIISQNVSINIIYN